METFLLILLIISGLLFIGQAVMGFVGVGFEIDFDDGASDSPFGFFTIRNMTTFVLGFSSGGYTLMKFGFPTPVAVISGLIFGGILSASIIAGMKALSRLEQINNIQPHEYRGLTAKVLVRVDGSRASAGKVEFVLHERVDEMFAVTDETSPLHPGEQVYVVRLLENGTLLVAKSVI
jgi:hypothetical protein